MKLLFKSAAAVFLMFAITVLPSYTKTQLPTPNSEPPTDIPTETQKIQVAILLDVSNSMDGLIEQAKAQLWNMVSVMGKAKCGNQHVAPQIEIALYEYGRSSNDPKEGFVKQINSFTNDLDQVSKNLFNLSTNGGDEYCGHVIFSSLKELKWDPSNNNYKVIFIAGNEDFLQGDVVYTKACEDANKKGVVVNTIYCGDRMQGIKEHWNLNAECGQGNYTNISQDEKIQEIPTPYDSVILSLNTKLNGTYIGYGSMGAGNLAKQEEVDRMNYSMSPQAATKRAAVKGNKNLYNNESWDLVDAVKSDSTIISKLDRKTLSPELQKKSSKELGELVQVKTKERGLIQKEISDLNTKRENFIAGEKAKNASIKNASTLESEVEKMIRAQARRYKMVIE